MGPWMALQDSTALSHCALESRGELQETREREVPTRGPHPAGALRRAGPGHVSPLVLHCKAKRPNLRDIFRNGGAFRFDGSAPGMVIN